VQKARGNISFKNQTDSTSLYTSAVCAALLRQLHCSAISFPFPPSFFLKLSSLIKTSNYSLNWLSFLGSATKPASAAMQEKGLKIIAGTKSQSRH